MKKTLLIAALCGCTAGVKPAQTGKGGSGGASVVIAGGSGTTGSGGSTVITGAAGTGGSGTNTDASINPDSACAAESVGAQPVPLDLYVLMDSSKSMLETTTAGTNKWKAVSDAMSAFFADAGSAGLGVAIKYFPAVQNIKDTCAADGDCGTFGPCDFRKTCVPTASSTMQVSPLCVDASTCGTQTCSRIKECGAGSGSYCAAGPTAPATACMGCADFAGYCHNRDICTGASYATPDIPITALPTTTFGPMLMAHAPGGFTPTGPALTGALQFARQRLTSTPDHRIAVVLVTDGLPGGFLPGFPPPECMPSDIAGIAAVAGGVMGRTGSPPVLTFVIGVFAPGAAAATAQTNLDMLATAGGTAPAVVIDTGQNVTSLLQNALKQVQSKAIACTYKIPPPRAGSLGIDFGKVNVNSVSGAGATTVIGKTTKAACDARGGWYYDVEPTAGTPTEIIACDATCQKLQTDIEGHVDIALGCMTVTIN